jgi:hypothetical protein
MNRDMISTLFSGVLADLLPLLDEMTPITDKKARNKDMNKIAVADLPVTQ